MKTWFILAWPHDFIHCIPQISERPCHALFRLGLVFTAGITKKKFSALKKKKILHFSIGLVWFCTNGGIFAKSYKSLFIGCSGHMESIQNIFDEKVKFKNF